MVGWVTLQCAGLSCMAWLACNAGHADAPPSALPGCPVPSCLPCRRCLRAGVVAQYLTGGGKPQGHLFDLGVHDNLHAVCGDNLLCWLLPGRAAAEGDGVSFPTRL